MAATVVINEYNGAGGTKTDKTSGSVRFKNADDATVDLNNPLVKPTSNRKYLYEKFLRLSASGEYTQISNLRAYSDGSNGMGTGVKVWYALGGSFRQPVIPTETADPPQSDIVGSPLEDMSDFFGLTSGSPGDLDAINTGPFTPLSPNADVQEIGDFLVLVCEAETTVSAGLTSSEDVTFAWDEFMLEHAEIRRVNGTWSAAGEGVGMTVHTEQDNALFKRRAARTDGTSACWLVGELDGVRVYVVRQGGETHVVMTREDLYPDPKAGGVL